MKSFVTQLILLVVLFFFYSTPGNAQSGGEYEIVKSSINSGGGIVSGGEFEINSSIAQTVTQSTSNGEYQLESGFWTSASNLFTDILFKNSFEAIVVLLQTINEVEK